MTAYSLKLSQGTLSVEASAKDPQTAKDLFDYALDKTGLIPKSWKSEANLLYFFLSSGLLYLLAYQSPKILVRGFKSWFVVRLAPQHRHCIQRTVLYGQKHL